jgi:5-methylcytosine-specific restriction endonuclease McrA
MSAKDKLRKTFLDNLGTIFDSDQLREIAGISEWARRVRELRNEEGYQILTYMDKKSLKQGQYLLETDKRMPSFSRGISNKTRALVLDRDGSTCKMCGAVAGEPHHHDNRLTKLHVSHIIDKSMGGTDDLSNLRALCSICNEGAANITPDRPTSDKLLIQIRRAGEPEQLKVLQWLMKKFHRDFDVTPILYLTEKEKDKDQ